ncbi:glycosyltransferase [Verrucomicrobiaceae bacterium 227]
MPGPAKWSAVIRDWFVLAVLRIFYRRVVFHWHAIGQGEWANGSERVSLSGPTWLEQIARKFSRFVLEEPHASIVVSEESGHDASAVGSLHSLVVCNGIADPCPNYGENLKARRGLTRQALEDSPQPVFRILFLSHGTEEKGLFDAISAIRALFRNTEESWHYEVSLAGGVSSNLTQRFEAEIEELKAVGGARLDLHILGYLGPREKTEAYSNHDVFLSPSRWESFGLTTVEAMAHGMHIVASASDGVQGVLPEGYPYLTSPGDCTAFALSLVECCKDLREGRICEIGEDVRSRFLRNYQLDSFAENLRGALKTSCGVTQGKRTTLIGDNFSREARQQIPISVYLADQNPGYDRSYGISRMSHVVLKALFATARVRLTVIVSKTSQRAPSGVAQDLMLPWGTRRKLIRFLTDHLHPLLLFRRRSKSVNYYPKGYLPLLSSLCSPSVVTIHDTIIQYDKDHYPEWRSRFEYGYWALMLKHTLRHADWILTVSESSKEQILSFMERHGLPGKEITVTYEPCAYDDVPQPGIQEKKDYVIHLSSKEPHKGTDRLVRWWKEKEAMGRVFPTLHLIGAVPDEVKDMIEDSGSIVKRPFLTEEELQKAYRDAKALILPSEIEGFGLPALEAYYLGTPVCFVRGTSVEEVLGVATTKGGMSLDDPDSLLTALEEVLQMTPEEVRTCGHKLREIYSLKSVSERMFKVFHEVSRQYS